MAITTEALCLAYDSKLIVDGLTIEIPEGQITALVGPNGSGKSTILKALSRILRPRGGLALLDGTDIHSLPTKEVARRLAILPQSSETPGGLTVEQLVLYGRAPYQGLLGMTSDEDRAKVRWAMEVTDLAGLADRPVSSLSGGQRQRAWIAMALAQDTQTLLLDEPTTYLDMAYQVDVMDLLKRLNRDQGRTIVMVLHDLNQAARYADHLIAISGGKPLVQGAPATSVTPEMLRSVFGVDAEVMPDPRTGDPICIVYGADNAAMTPS